MQSVRVIKDSHCNQNHLSLIFYRRKLLWFCLLVVSCSLKYTALEHYLFLTGETNCRKGILFVDFFDVRKIRQFEYLTALLKSFMKTLKGSGPGIDPRGTADNNS
jgi:hypothetical protein